ncbi:MAG: transcriptional repressor [Acidiphilium sp. 37-67-22]|jgi:Fur family zinc uptake transcriptional regulator|uniref:Fur family transcriptional regulator n=1 Tax=unclassified Acidiphilium TaxID=2617493 RepID=UPI000BD1E2D9|nr:MULTISPECIES: Fur family transcriptional regulator [unclassified Acidiphilium]OYV86202.1 MAG: transcriptional repressor [Acidiphilium sp. 21-68-69]OYW08533.1 MAG: transcriptional repressor [Acidiphilium sp. 37-67-22]OYV55330.1 MAG: transcriptional repressor [Acidiphilium sp. 20-67-58]HQT61001.1 Fur family transcriptional regulator [Acidiphilium sp.]HQT74756.1 Fur family transcriptional regulator [Acidiphilium sp.]
MPSRPSATIERRLDEAAAACAAAGRQLTRQRRAVLGLILAAEGPLTAYELLDRLRESHRGATPATIYRALEFLIAADLVHKVESLSAYVSCADPAGEAQGHTHAAQFFICRQCGAVAELEDEAVAAALEAAAARIGFAAGSAIVEVGGLCAACAGG